MKRINARLIIVMFLFSVASISYLSSCARKSLVKVEPVKKKGKVGEEVVIQRSSDKIPKWAFGPEFQVVKEKKERFIVVKVDISNPDRRAAERIAEGELRKRVAEGIKTLVDSQFREALTGTETDFSQSFESYVETVANNVPVVGLMVTDTYWEKIQRFKTEKEVEYYYRVLKLARMPYEHYVSARDNALQNALQQARNEQERENLERLIQQLKQEEEA